MTNALSLEERTMGFLLQISDNVTCRGLTEGEKRIIIPLLSEDDYQFLLKADCSELEHPAKPEYVGFVQRNPFLGLTGEKAFALHELLRAAVREGEYSLPKGLAAFSRNDNNAYGYNGYEDIFMELAAKLKVREEVKAGFEQQLDKLEKSFTELQSYPEVHPVTAHINLTEVIPQARQRIAAETYALLNQERAVVDILANVTPDSLQGYVGKYGMLVG